MTGAGLVFENTINLGNLLTMVGGAIIWAVTLAIAWTKLGGRIDMLQLQVTMLEKLMVKVTDVLEKFTTNETEVRLLKAQMVALVEDFSTLHKTVEALRRGEGYIQRPRRDSVDGEY